MDRLIFTTFWVKGKNLVLERLNWEATRKQELTVEFLCIPDGCPQIRGRDSEEEAVRCDSLPVACPLLGGEKPFPSPPILDPLTSCRVCSCAMPIVYLFLCSLRIKCMRSPSGRNTKNEFSFAGGWIPYIICFWKKKHVAHTEPAGIVFLGSLPGDCCVLLYTRWTLLRVHQYSSVNWTLSTGLPVLLAPTRLVVSATRPSRAMSSTVPVSVAVVVRGLRPRVPPTVCFIRCIL